MTEKTKDEIKFKSIQAEKPEPDALAKFVGKTLITMEGEPVVVETIVGSLIKQSRYEINGKHHVVMLSAHLQLEGVKITPALQDKIDAFDEMIIEHIERAPRPLDAPKKPPTIEVTQ